MVRSLEIGGLQRAAPVACAFGALTLLGSGAWLSIVSVLLCGGIRQAAPMNLRCQRTGRGVR